MFLHGADLSYFGDLFVMSQQDGWHSVSPKEMF